MEQVKYKRHLSKLLRELLKQFSCVMISGPRQIGKTSMVIDTIKGLGKWNDVDLSKEENKENALKNPILFFEENKTPLFIDEIQEAPKLMSYIKNEIDKTKNNGIFILTGSQMFKFNKDIKERLSTRAALLDMCPLSNSEIQGRDNFPFIIDSKHFIEIKKYASISVIQNLENILKGSMPDIMNGKIKNTSVFYSSYINNTIISDITEHIATIRDDTKFNNFLKSLAIRSGQIVNLYNTAQDAGIDNRTATIWLDALKSLGIIFFVHPFSNKKSKTLLKKPKLYFYDTGLLCHLLKITDAKGLYSNSSYGNVYETWCVSEITKTYINEGLMPPISYLQNSKGEEKLDVIIEQSNGVYLIEIKTSTNINSKHIKGFELLDENVKVLAKAVICPITQISSYSKDILLIPNTLI
ncbi:MAG: AAA family ATPase [Mycoplasmataceae bacterium]|nr:AAA family ATPase [Mycoplasmataceae bacterium]